MTGHDYEYVVAEYLRRRGYHGVKVTKGSGDFGVDVIASKHGVKYAVQCKLYSGPVGLSAIQEVVAGKACYGCTGAMVVTNSTFTAAAEQLALRNDVILLGGVSPSKSRRPLTFSRVVLWLLWLGIVGGIISEVIVPNDPSGNVFEIVLIPLLTAPIWIKWLWRLVAKLIRMVSKHRNSSAETTHLADSVSYSTATTPTKPSLPTYQSPSPHPTSAYSLEELEDAAKIMTQGIYASLESETESPDLIASAIALVVHDQLCSVSLIQRRLKLGYMRASKVVDILEQLGVVGPYMGSTPRTILMTDKELLGKANRPFS